jgi:phospholipid/cholesterol/gamma-HCH transport system permease protein
MVLFKLRSDASAAEEAEPGVPGVSVSGTAGEAVVALSGDWTTVTIASTDRTLRDIEARPPSRRMRIDLSAVGRLDTAGAWVMHRLVSDLRAGGVEVELSGVGSDAAVLIDAVREASAERTEPPRGRRDWFVLSMLESLGRGVYGMLDDAKLDLHILGATIRGAQMKLGRGHAVNPAAIVTHIDRIGIGAIAVVLLMSAIVGGIIAQQGAFQLRFFGAEIFVVDLVGILVLRELGVLMTAIMLAGRTGSAITAEIGSMKMREEVDALTVIGLNPVGVLVFPRLVALVIALPCLTVLANFAALGGAMLVAYVYSDIPPEAFIDRLHAGIDLTTIFAGLIKAPFMAIIIGIIAAAEGMKVEGSAESLGRHVTSSVVKSIFVVIVVDGFFAMFYAAIDF